MIYTPRAMIGGELADIRKDGQYSSLYLSIYKPPTVYTALIDQTFPSLDKVLEITYGTGSGTLAEVKPGMSMYVGTSAGASDVGIVRIRKDPTGSVFYIGEESDLPLASGQYLTVVDDFGIWPRHIAIGAGNEAFMDGDIPYTDQHENTNPIPCIGPRFIPVWLGGADIDVPFDASLTWTLPDTAVTGHSWSAPGASGTTGMATATPVITYDTPGVHRVAYTATAANGNTTTAYAFVQVFDMGDNMPINQFTLKTCTGSHIEGGWKFQVTMWSQADFVGVVDRAMVVLFARDFYGTTEVSIGQVADRENIVAIGWISGESIVWDPDGSYVDFTVETAQGWLKRKTGFPIGIQNSTIAPTVWTSWQALTVDDSLYHLFLWQSTVIPVIDVFLTGDVRVSPEQYAPGEIALFEQLTYLLKNTIVGQAGCDRFNRLVCEIDAQLVPPAGRSGFPVIMDLETQDWRDQMKITRIPVPVTSQVNLSGVAINLPNAPVPLFSLAPGHPYIRWGKPARKDRLLLSDQAQSNQLAAMQLAWDNHGLEFDPDLAGNNRMLDVFPSHQFVGVVVNADDTPRGFSFDGHTIVREVNVSVDTASKEPTGFLQISWHMESETFPGNSSNGDVPGFSSVPVVDVPTPPLARLPGRFPVVSPNPPPPEYIDTLIIWVSGQGVFYTKNLSTTDGKVKWFAMNSGLSSPTTVMHVEISASGKCYCQQGNSSIWVAPYIGAAWTLLFDTTMIGNPEGYPFPRGHKVIGFGVNRDADDEILICAGLTVTIFSSVVLYNWHGSSSGVSLVTANHYNNADGSAGLGVGACTFGDGNWVVSYRSDAGATSMLFNSSGSIPILETILTGNLPYHTRSRYAGEVLMMVTTSPLEISIDNAEVWSSLSAAPVPYGGEAYYTDMLGTSLLVGTSTLGMRRSSDGGATWGATSTLAAVTAVFNLGTPSDWVFAFIGHILYTPDFGDTFVYKTGDLQSWIGAFATIRGMRYM